VVISPMLDYQLIRAFAAVLDEGGFARAADKLCVTQSSVSQLVKQLEDQIGRALIIRESPPRPTESGLLLLRHYRQVLALESDTLGIISSQIKGRHPHIPIAVNTDSMFVWFPDATNSFLKDTGVTLEIFMDGHERTIEFLKSGEVAGCVTTERKVVEGCTATLIGSLRYALVAAPDFVQRWFPDGFTREAAMDAPVVNLDRNDNFQYQVLYKAFGDPQIMPPAQYIPIADKYFDGIQTGIGYGLAPLLTASEGLRNGSLIELDPSLRSELVLYWHCWKHPSDTLRALSEVIIREGGRLLG
jgi:LysR family transcriptional regulator, chromosome initiation inhibitor